ncbi:MAG: triphosphoribosyl-dephospho-CoA synthase [Hungatella sp.]|jgi:triphosphoribosyl-dephospho-CoA synthase|nr:triphosphoribosyl-dephospho-CoA synthase [Hungatella sp.]
MDVSSGVKPKETFEKTAFSIGNMAYQAMLEEVYTTPKPGLVDLYSPGAHKDMDVTSFERSAAALEPYFASMALEGMRFPHMPGLLFERIRRIGMAAEAAMYKATAGVNTHKGLIFHMGILSAAAGACMMVYGTVTIDCLIKMEQAMVRETLVKELKLGNMQSLNKHGIAGARGEAMTGYGSVRKIALPAMAKGLKEGREWNRIKLETLFMLMSQVEDSNIIARHDSSVLLKVQRMARDFLLSGGAYGDKSMVTLKQMDADFIKRNISAGGCADLLAVAIFINELIKEPVRGRFYGIRKAGRKAV